MAAQSRMQTAERGMLAVSAECETKSGTFHQDRVNIASEVEMLTTTFRGDAAVKFAEAMGHWGSYCDVVTNSLKDFSMLLKEHYRLYGQGNEQAVGAVQSLHNALPGI